MPRTKPTENRRARAAERTNEIRAAKRADMEMSFRDEHRSAMPQDLSYGGELADPFYWLLEHFEDRSSYQDITIVAKKLADEGRWIPKSYPSWEERVASHAQGRPRLPDALYLERAKSLLRSRHTFQLTDDFEERETRSQVRTAVDTLQALLTRLDQKPSGYGHNGPPDGAPEYTSEIAEIGKLRASLSALQFEVAQTNANLRRVVDETQAMQRWATEAKGSSVPPLKQKAIEKFVETYAADMAHLAAAVTAGVLSQIVPYVLELIHFVVLWLCVQLPAMNNETT